MAAAKTEVAPDDGGEQVAPQREEFDASLDIQPLDTPAPRRRGRPPGSKNRTTRARSTGNLETQIGALLVTFNMPLQIIPALAKDALDTVEIQALAKATASECEHNSTFRKYVEMALKVQGATSLVGVVGIIGARRAIRHDLIPMPDPANKSMIDAVLGQSLSLLSSGQAVNPNLAFMQAQQSPEV